MEKLLAILTDIRPDVDFEKEDKLIDHAILDSFDLITIAGEISETFDISISPGDLLPKDFNSARAIWELVQSYLP